MITTPGPWTYEPHPEQAGCYMVLAKQGPLEVQPAEVYGELDARLIAAAPEMLEALQYLVQALGPEAYTVGLDRNRMAGARAAIAKATGGE